MSVITECRNTTKKYSFFFAPAASDIRYVSITLNTIHQHSRQVREIEKDTDVGDAFWKQKKLIKFSNKTDKTTNVGDAFWKQKNW